MVKKKNLKNTELQVDGSGGNVIYKNTIKTFYTYNSLKSLPFSERAASHRNNTRGEG